MRSGLETYIPAGLSYMTDWCRNPLLLINHDLVPQNPNLDLFISYKYFVYSCYAIMVQLNSVLSVYNKNFILIPQVLGLTNLMNLFW